MTENDSAIAELVAKMRTLTERCLSQSVPRSLREMCEGFQQLDAHLSTGGAFPGTTETVRAPAGVTITMTATYDTTEWESEEPDTDPTITHGFTDPSNPWGGFKHEMPDGCVGDAAKAWMAENVERLEFGDFEEAAQFVADFPGGVWDYRECEADQDYRTGVYTRVTLHVESNIGGLLVRVAEIEAERNAHLEALRTRS